MVTRRKFDSLGEVLGRAEARTAKAVMKVIVSMLTYLGLLRRLLVGVV